MINFLDRCWQVGWLIAGLVWLVSTAGPWIIAIAYWTRVIVEGS
jgi:hypothetical protein